MGEHRVVPVSKGLDDGDTATRWRCVGCGAEADYRDELEPDDVPCPAIEFLFGDES